MQPYPLLSTVSTSPWEQRQVGAFPCSPESVPAIQLFWFLPPHLIPQLLQFHPISSQNLSPKQIRYASISNYYLLFCTIFFCYHIVTVGRQSCQQVPRNDVCPVQLQLDPSHLWPNFSWILRSLHFWCHKNLNFLQFLPQHLFFHIILVTCKYSFEFMNLIHSFSTKFVPFSSSNTV